MSNLTIIIEQTENNYAAHIEGVDGIVATGHSVDEIKTKMIEAIDLYVETCKDMDLEIPKELLGDYNLTFKMEAIVALCFWDVNSSTCAEGENRKRITQTGRRITCSSPLNKAYTAYRKKKELSIWRVPSSALHIHFWYLSHSILLLLVQNVGIDHRCVDLCVTQQP